MTNVWPTGTTVELTLYGGAQVTGPLATQFIEGQDRTWWISGVGPIRARVVASFRIVARPLPMDSFDNGTVLYAVNNGYHHVWVKSGGQWYTANRKGTVSWAAILAKCANWRMSLVMVHGYGTPLVYSPEAS